MRKRITHICIIAAFLLLAPKLHARSDYPAFTMQIGGGLSTYTSQLVSSVDTSTSSGVTFQTYSGSDGQMAAFVNQVNNTTSFQFTQGGTPSGSTTSFTDSGILFRFMWLLVGPVWSSLSAQINQEGTPHFNGTGVGTGFRGVLNIPISRGSHFFMSITQSSYGTFSESVQAENTTSIGSRSDSFIGGRILLTKSLISMDMGYRQQSFALSLASTNASEVLTTTWIGFNLHWNP